MKQQFKNASLVSVVNGSIVVKDSTGKEHTFTNASVVSVNNGTITLEVKHEFKKGDLVKIIEEETHYHIFDYMAGLYYYTFGGLDSTLKLRKSHLWDYNRNCTILPTTKEEQEHFDKICKEKGYIFNKETFQWEAYKWKPKPGEPMYFISGTGQILHYLYDDTDRILKKYVDINNCFKTEEEAQIKRNQIKNLFKE